MIEVRDTGREVRKLRWRLALAWLLMVGCFGLLSARFYWLQVHRYEAFHAQAEDNRIALVPIPPARGLIYDRNGVLLADNRPAYTLEIIPEQVADLERTIDALATVIEISPRDRRRFKRLREDSRSYESLPIRTRLTDEELARFAVAKYRFPGVEIRARLFRDYPLGATAAHLVGYIGRISGDDKRRIEDREQQSDYAGSTHIGKTGVELSYEQALLGKVGIEEIEVSAGGRTVRSLSRTPPVAGSNLHLSIDIALQQLVEQWFGDRRGALVAIDPKTGEVLTIVSKPTFDPNLFVDGIDPQSWGALNTDPDKPLLNRPLRGTYPPGSTYKPFMALAALSSGIRTPQSTINDPGYFQLGEHRFRDSKPGGQGVVDLHKSLVVSSDTYYYKTAYEMGVDAIHDFMKPWGFGQLTGIDLPNETTGVLPSKDWKLKRYRKKWFPGETPSIGIGQGYNAFTMLQLAHATATLANDGQPMRPHVVREIEEPDTRERYPAMQAKEPSIVLKPDHLRRVKAAMIDVNRFGTSRIAFANTEYVAAGKTGTAQVIGIRQNEKYDARKIAERHRDHSLYMAYAPAEDPKIALAVIVENGGFGAQAAAPIARRVFDYYLLGKIGPDPLATPIAAPAAASAANEETQARNQSEQSEEFRDVPERDPQPDESGPDTPSDR